MHMQVTPSSPPVVSNMYFLYWLLEKFSFLSAYRACLELELVLKSYIESAQDVCIFTML